MKEKATEAVCSVSLGGKSAHREEAALTVKGQRAVGFFWWLLMKSREAFNWTRLEDNFRNLNMPVMVDADDETEEGKASVEEARSAYNEKDLSGDGQDRPTAD